MFSFSIIIFVKIFEITLNSNLFNLLVQAIAGRPGSSEVHRHPLTRWDVSSIPANGVFLTKN